jgi:very-short-patch-repair endonuclease
MNASQRRNVHAITVRQHALITAGQARGAGLSARQVEWALSTGEWCALRDGVFAVAGAPKTAEQAVLAAVLAAGPAALASHATAARLWGMPRIVEHQLELVAPFGHHHRLPGVVGHRSRALFDDDGTVYRRIPVTRAERTLVDLTGRCSIDVLGKVLDDGLRRKTMRLDRLRCTVGRLSGGPGRRLAIVHDLLASRLPGYDPSDSDLETLALRMIAAAGLPIPRQQHRVVIGTKRYYIDLAYPDLKIGIELDGWEWHRFRSSFDGDRARGNTIAIAGWMPLAFTSNTIGERLVRDIVDARVARAHETTSRVVS